MSPRADRRPRVGVPWCSSAGEKANRRRAYDRYLRAVERAGGEAVEVSLLLPRDELRKLAATLDGIVLTGSAADIDTRRYTLSPHQRTASPDRKRELTDDFLLDHALATGKPVLAICYGAQILNVHLHGSLVQDIPDELRSAISHERRAEGGNSRHPVRIATGRLSDLTRGTAARVNSSHHQSISQPGRGLRVTATAPDGVVEAVEWIAGPEWIVGVQWHPERMPGDPLAVALFAQLVSEARAAALRQGNLGDVAGLHAGGGALESRPA